VRKHARGRRLSIGAGNGCDRNSTRRTRRKQHVDDGATNIPWRALARRDVHAKARTRIHFANTATCVAIGFRNIPGQKIDPSNVQASRLDRSYRHLPVVGMH
jgi:hypothetical protein